MDVRAVARYDAGIENGVDAVRPRRSAALWEALGLALVGLGVLGLVLVIAGGAELPADDTLDVLVLGTVGLGAAAALLGDVSGRLTGNVRPSWLGAALALYTFIVVPSGTLLPEFVEDDQRIGIAIRLTAFVVILGLLAVAVHPPHRVVHWPPWAVAGAGVLLALGAGRVAAAEPATEMLTQPAALSVAVLAAWLLMSAWLTVTGLLRGDRTVTLMALGLTVIAGAHVYQVLVGAEFAHPEIVFAALRLGGVLAVLVGTLQLLGGDVAAVRSEHEELSQELRIAAQHMGRAGAAAAERDHELRNGLAGLTGVTQLLSIGNGSAEQEGLKAAVLHELARLVAMVEGEAIPSSDAPTRLGTFDVAAVLAEAVALRRAAGRRVDLSCAPGVRARGCAETLAQVLSNLLANCARHAPGFAVHISAGAVGSRVVVEVADDGPGVAPGMERLVVRRGVHSELGGGQGLGLDVSRELMATMGGSLRVNPYRRNGFTVVLELVRADGKDGEQVRTPLAGIPEQAAPVEALRPQAVSPGGPACR